MNVIEAAKAAGMNVSLWDYGAGSIVFTMGTEGLARGALERFAQIIRNQALEDAAKCCIAEQVEVEACSNKEDEAYNTATEHCANSIRSMKKDQT